MKISRTQFRRQKWTLCLCLLALATPDLRAQTEDTAELELVGQRAEIQSLLNDGIFLEAIRKLENYLEERPGDIAARRQLSKAYFEVEDYFRLRYHSGVILQEFPEDPQALVWSEIADEVISEKYPVMVKDLLDALEEDPENTVLRRELISLYMIGDEGEKAAEQFRILLDLQPENEALWLDYARNLFWSSQLEASLVAYEQYLKVAQEPKDVRLEIARVHAANKQFGIAVEQLRNLIEDVPDNHAARALLADIFRWNDDAMAAEEIYRGILKEDPEHGPSLKGLEELAEMARRRVITTASMNIDSMREKVEEDPEDMDLVLQLARLYTTNNRYAEAAETYAKYLDQRPDETPIRREYAFTLSIEEEYDEAIRQLRIYLEEYPEDMTERMRIARMLIWQDKTEAAKRELLDMESQIPDNPELHWNLARIYEIEGDWPSAIARYETLRKHAPRFEVATAKIREIESNPYYQIAMLERRIEKDPNDSEARLQLARTFLDLERFYEAQQQAQAVLDYAPEDEQAQRIVGWADLGVSEVRRERIEELLRVLDVEPENFEATLELARFYREEDDYPEALRYYYIYLNAFPQDREARLEYARVLSWEPEQRESAIREYAILIEDQPDNIDLRLTYFELLSAEGALTADHRALMAEIEDILRDRLFTDREDAESLLFMGRLYQINSKWSEALDFYRAAIAVSQRDDPQENTIRERIESILALPDFQLAELFTQVEENPSDVLTRLILARQLFDLKRYYEAKEQATQVLAYDAGNAEASRIVGWSDIGIEEVLFERIRTARSEIRENPNDMEAALSLARALKEAEIYPESLRYYYHYLTAYPGDVDVRQEYAQVLSWEPSQLPQAVREFAVIAELRPDDIALQLQYYELANRLGDLTRNDLAKLSAIEDLMRERISFNDMDSEALFYLGRLHQIDGNWNSALDYYEASIAAGGQDATVQERIDSIAAMPDFQIALLESRIANNPDNVDLRMSLARQLFDLERYYEAKEHATQVLAYAPENVEASRIADWSDIGIEEALYERIRTARSEIRQNPDNLDVALDLARALKEAEIYPEALRYYYHYLKAFPADVDVREEYAEVLSWEPSQLPSAVREFGVLAEMLPDDMALQLQYYELANRLGELNRRDLTILSAIEDRLRERIFFNDMDSEALFYLGRLHQLDDNWNSALDYYEAAIAAGSQDSTIQNRIATITANPDFQIATLEARAANNPEDLELNLSLVRLLLQNERYYQAQQQAEQLLQFSGRNQEARDMYNYASSWIEAQQAQDLQNLRVRVTQNPRDLDAQLELARILRNEGAFEEARQRYRLYLRAFPEDLEIRREYADTLAWSGENSDEAISEYRDLLFAYPHDRELKLQYARMLSWNPKYWNEAEEVLEELSIYERDNPEIVLMKADILRFRGRYGAAQRLYDQVLQRGAPVDGYYYDDREQRYIYQNADVGIERMSDRIPDRMPARMSDRMSDRMSLRSSDRMIDRMPARDIYRPNFDEATVRSYRDSILDTNPNSPRNMMRYPQGSVSPQTAPDQPENSVDHAAAVGHARDESQASAQSNQSISRAKTEAATEAAPAQQHSLMLARYSGEKIEWRRPEPADYQVVRAEMVLDPTDRNPLGARNYAQRPTGSRPEDGRYDASRRAESLRPAPESMRPLRSPESVADAQPTITVEARPREARPLETRPFEARPRETRPVETRPFEARPRETRPVEARPRPERYAPEQRVNAREFYDAPEPILESGRYSERAPRTTVRPQFERSDAPAERRSRLVAEDPQFSHSRTYTIPGDPQVRAEPPAPVYTPPEPVERVIYREPVYKVRPEVIIQREIEYVPVPDRYVELPRHNLDDRRIFDDDRVVTRAPARRAEPRVFVPQYQPLPEPPRFYRERDRGLDTRIGTSLPSSSINERALFDDRLREPVRYDYSRTPLEPAPVRYIRERVATPDLRDPYGEYSSMLPPPTRFNPGRTSYRESRPSSSFREVVPQRRYESPELIRERSSRVMEPDSRGYYRLPESDLEGRTRAWEGESFDDRRWREPVRDPQFRESVRDPRLREPVRDPQLRETLPPARNQGLPYYYNSTEDDYQTPKYSAQPSIRFERAQYQPQSNLFIQPNDRDRRQMRDFVRAEDRQDFGQRNQAARPLRPQGYARPDDREFVRPRDRDEPERRPSDWSRGESRAAAMYQRPARSYTLPATGEAPQPRTYADEAVRSQAPAPTYRRPEEREPVQSRTYLPEERQPVQPRTYLPESGRAPAAAPSYIRPQMRQPMAAESSWREMDRRPAQAPTAPLRFEGSSSTINRLPYEERGRTYLPPENTPISVPPQVERLPRQTDNFNRDLLEQPRAVPATEATTFGRRQPIAVRTPRPAQTVERIQGVPRTASVRAPRPVQTVERIQGVPFTADSVFNNEAYARALQGKRAIAQLLRPELMVDFGYESDTDGFTGTHIGGRYNHFTSAGNLYYLGLSFDNFSEDDLTPIDSIDAQSLLFGASGYMNERLRGFVDFTLTNYSDGPDTTLSFTGGGSYNLDGVNTLTASYSHFDFFREAKTVRSLLGEVSADRFRVDWTSNPIEAVEGRPFGERIFFEGSLAFTSLSDNNSSIAYSLRPYYRIADNPNIDVSVGWQGLSYADQSPLYYSPENNQGPTLGARISGETLWGLIYDVRGLVTFPTEEASSRSLLFSLRKDFTNHFSAGANIFLTEAPRADDDDYRFGSLLFDLRYQF